VVRKQNVGLGFQALKVDPATDWIYMARRGGSDVEVLDPLTLMARRFLGAEGEVVFMTIDGQENSLLLLMPGRKPCGSSTSSGTTRGRRSTWGKTVLGDRVGRKVRGRACDRSRSASPCWSPRCGLRRRGRTGSAVLQYNSRRETRTPDASGTKTTQSSNLFAQQYRLNLDKRIYPTFTVSAGGRSSGQT